VHDLLNRTLSDFPGVGGSGIQMAGIERDTLRYDLFFVRFSPRSHEGRATKTLGQDFQERNNSNVMNPTIQLTVDSGFCTGCAMCEVICPKKCVSVQETPGGLLEAVLEEKQCSQCGACVKVCGGLALRTEAIRENVDPFIGTALKAFLVKANDPLLRKNGQSGGAVTAIVSHLLQKGEINGVLATFMPKDGSLKPYSKIVKNGDELIDSQGSKYVPIPWARAFRELDPKTDRIATVGIPCQYRSLFNAQISLRKSWENAIALKIGLVCEGILSFAVYDHLLSTHSIPRENCREYRFKSKIPNGWPGDGRAIGFDETEYFVPNKARTSCKDAFRPVYCRLCFDKINVLADIVCMDPWGITRDKEGYTVVVVRTERGLAAFQSVMNAGVLTAEELSWENILKCQEVEKRRKNWTTATQITEQRKKVLPGYPIDAKWFAKPIGFGERRLLEFLLARSWLLREARERNGVVESVTTFNEKLKAIKKQIAFWNQWSPLSLFKWIWRKMSSLVR